MNAGSSGVGALVVDVRRDRVGTVVGSADGRLSLRALDGREWEAFSSDVRPATTGDELWAKTADFNRRNERVRGAV